MVFRLQSGVLEKRQIVAAQQELFDLPHCPESWFHVCGSEELRRGPMGVELAGWGSVVAYRTGKGEVAAVSARCCHAGSNLGDGAVVGEYAEGRITFIIRASLTLSGF